jgi:hypothetical protein
LLAQGGQQIQPPIFTSGPAAFKDVFSVDYEVQALALRAY